MTVTAYADTSAIGAVERRLSEFAEGRLDFILRSSDGSVYWP